MESPGDAASAGLHESAAESTADDGGTRRRGRAPVRLLAAAALIAVLAGAGSGGWLLYQRHEKDVAAQQALSAAENFVVMLTSVDSNTLDKHVADVLDGSTGDFSEKYAKTVSGQHHQHVVENKVTTHGKVVESAVKSVSANKVQVLLMVDQSVTSSANPEPYIDRSRVKVTMQKVNGRWLASDVELL
ncbi:hypothetical protein [Mycobacterium noviomagense]|uniref:Mce associated membrane protein n=1 Tax=Mycobacterium noviomagense TaxID=459858 RepID=A0A7I7P7A2_9MYCO|nr:hypothetical protein [Mycobacterium noviomagense]BBY04776.1 hypothetical protein MNVI_00940 [Mycobacterium noviomagense]